MHLCDGGLRGRVPLAQRLTTVGRRRAALTRAAERADRTGAPALATASYTTAAKLAQADAAAGQQAAAAALWEHAAAAAVTNADYPTATEHAGHAAYLARLGDTGAAEAAAGEAYGIAQRLGCQPLLDRADTIQPARPRTAAS